MPRAQGEIPPEQAAAACREPLEAESGGTPHRRESQRWCLYRRRIHIRADEHGDRAALHEHGQHHAAENDHEHAEDVGRERERSFAQPGDHERDDLANVAAGYLESAAADQQGDEEGGGHERHDEQQLECGFSDELQKEDFPIGRGDEGATCEERLHRQSGSHLGRQSDSAWRRVPRVCGVRVQGRACVISRAFATITPLFAALLPVRFSGVLARCLTRLVCSDSSGARGTMAAG
jgi:hypothetical protein